MAILAFRCRTISIGAFGVGQSRSVANIVVSTGDFGAGTGRVFVGRVNHTGEASTVLTVENIDAGGAICNTRSGGQTIGTDLAGRTIPHNLAGKYVDIAVDCGGFLGRYEAPTKVSFRVSDRLSDGNRGNVLYHWDQGEMLISAGRLGSDFAISGLCSSVSAEELRRTNLESRVLFNLSPEEASRQSVMLDQAGR